LAWGGGQVPPGVITGGAGHFEVSGLHTYTTKPARYAGLSTGTRDGEQSISWYSVITVDPAATTSGDATCTIQDDGSIPCWGDNSDGEAIPPAGAFNALAMTWNHGCA